MTILDLIVVTHLGVSKTYKIMTIWAKKVIAFHYFYVFSSERRKCLEKNRHYGLFWSDRFYLLFCILSFTSF